MADPDAGSVPAVDLVICHNDVCLENLVYRDRVAVGLLDFDFAAPGRRVHDLATFARMNVPIDNEEDAALLGRCGPFEPIRRLRVVADAYGLWPGSRRVLGRARRRCAARGGQFLQRRLDEGNAAFRQMVETTGGMAKFDRRRAWFTAPPRPVRRRPRLTPFGTTEVDKATPPRILGVARALRSGSPRHRCRSARIPTSGMPTLGHVIRKWCSTCRDRTSAVHSVA